MSKLKAVDIMMQEDSETGIYTVKRNNCKYGYTMAIHDECAECGAFDKCVSSEPTDNCLAVVSYVHDGDVVFNHISIVIESVSEARDIVKEILTKNKRDFGDYIDSNIIVNHREHVYMGCH